jgi:sialate O-acetylesterase
MIASWRKLWSAQHGTTDPLAKFGVVSLASGGSEGHDDAMAAFRWSQTANYGRLPNAAMPQTFLAHAYDLGDPMDGLRPPCVIGKARRTNMSAFNATAGGTCVWPKASEWNRALRPLRAEVFKNQIPSFMGGIHPRVKHEVGRRLALAFDGVGAPTLAGCTLRPRGGPSDAGGIELRFNLSSSQAGAGGGDDALLLQWTAADYNMSGWAGQDSSSLMVCVGPPAGEAGDEQDSALWRGLSRRQQLGSCLANASFWTAAALVAGDDGATLTVDLAAASTKGSGSPPIAVRYGWPLSKGGDTCCPFVAVKGGTAPCIPGSCPIITKEDSLPANPFYAAIGDDGECVCAAPQVCGGLGGVRKSAAAL